MIWDGLQDVVNETTRDVMAEPDPVVYTAGDVVIADLMAIFQSSYTEVSIGEGEVDSRTPMLIVNDADMAANGVTPAVEDRVEVRGGLYQVTAVEPDEKGQTRLRLLRFANGEGDAV